MPEHPRRGRRVRPDRDAQPLLCCRPQCANQGSYLVVAVLHSALRCAACLRHFFYDGLVLALLDDLGHQRFHRRLVVRSQNAAGAPDLRDEVEHRLDHIVHRPLLSDHRHARQRVHIHGVEGSNDVTAGLGGDLVLDLLSRRRCAHEHVVQLNLGQHVLRPISSAVWVLHAMPSDTVFTPGARRHMCAVVALPARIIRYHWYLLRSSWPCLLFLRLLHLLLFRLSFFLRCFLA